MVLPKPIQIGGCWIQNGRLVAILVFVRIRDDSTHNDDKLSAVFINVAHLIDNENHYYHRQCYYYVSILFPEFRK